MNAAMLSGWHVHAKQYAKQFNSIEGCKVTKVWDEDPERGASWANELECDYEASLEAVLADKSIDAVIICTPTNMHTEVLQKAAVAGKHIFTEKILTITAADAEAVREAVLKNKIHFTISFPHESRPELLSLHNLVKEGKLGRITYARVRNCHGGAIKGWLPEHFYNPVTCGGGAMIDLGAHPMYLLLWLLGKPQEVSSHFTNITGHAVEDNAVSVITFENGAVGVSETGFVSPCDPFICEVSGTAGYASIKATTLTYKLVDQDEKEILIDEMPSADKPMLHWVSNIKNNNEDRLYNIDEAVALSYLMEAAYVSYSNGLAAKVY